MKIWIVNPYGTLPDEGWREYRSSMLASALAQEGHEVTWWLSNYEHRSKTYRSGPAQRRIGPNIAVHLVPCPPYSGNISFARIRYEQRFGAAFYQLAQGGPKPDVVVLADPCLFYGADVLKYVRQQGARLILDVLDLWPELFKVALPRLLRGAEKLLFRHLYARRARMVASADGLVAVTRDYLDAVLSASGKNPQRRLVAYLGVDLAEFDTHTAQPFLRGGWESVYWECRDQWVTVVYAGTLGEAYDLDTVCMAIAQIAQRAMPIRFVFLGDGPKRGAIEELQASFPRHLNYIGSVAATELPAIYQQCDVGLCSYAPGSTVSMPVKFYDYLAAGLAVVNALGGEIATEVATGLGTNYRAGNAEDLIATLESFAQDRPGLVAMRAKSRAIREKYSSRAQHIQFAQFVGEIGRIDDPSLLP